MKKMKKFITGTGITISTIFLAAIQCFAANEAAEIVTSKLSVLIELVTAVASSLGVLLVLWGLVEWGISFNDRDPSGQAQSYKRVIGGLVVILAPQILALLTT